MGWIIFYIVLLTVYCGSLLYSIDHPGSHPETVAKIAGAASLIAGLANALQKSSLRVYFLFQRIAIRFSPDTTSRWWFSARYDGHFPDSVIVRLSKHFQSKDFRFVSKVEGQDAVSCRVEIDQTLFLTIQFEPAHLAQETSDHLTVISRVMEVSYGHARKKIQHQIVPVLHAISDLLRPDNTSFELDVQFLKANPFFAVYIAHLRPDQVQDYRVVLHVDSGHSSGMSEKVEITKEKVHLSAKTTDEFKNLAEQFVLLSPDLKMLRTDR